MTNKDMDIPTTKQYAFLFLKYHMVAAVHLHLQREGNGWPCILRKGERKWDLPLSGSRTASLVSTFLEMTERWTKWSRLHWPWGVPDHWERISPEKHSQQVHQYLDTPMSLPNCASKGSLKLLHLQSTVSPSQPICLAKDMVWRVDNSQKQYFLPVS